MKQVMLIVSDSQITKLANSCATKYNRPFHGFRCHLEWGSVATKITANVWEIVQLSNLVTPLLYNGV